MRQKNKFFTDTLHIFVLFSFAISQPLFNLLSRNAEFFVARHSEPIDVIILVLILSVVLPAFLVLVETVAGILGRRVRKVVHGFFVAGLLAVIALPPLKRLFEFPGVALLVGAVVLGAAVTIAYFRFRPVRMFMTFLSPAILLFPLLLIFNSPVYKVVFPKKGPSAVRVEVNDPPPIIMVVFDEFPVTSLMDENRKIDPVRYPNFAALARDAYWFRNATTVSEKTTLAVPAMLCGSYPDPFKIPTASDYPYTLFTLLGGSYRIKEYESHTLLCPTVLSGDEKRRLTSVQRLRFLFLDLSAVYLHVVVPSDLTGGLPVVTQTWKGFWGETKGKIVHASTMNDVMDRARASYEDRAGIFAEFVASITVSEKPTFYFLDIMLPHLPWEYLPSGKKYSRVGWELPGLNLKHERWDEDDWLVIQGYQRHLLQVGFVDKLVGDLLARLGGLDLYDRSLIVVTADHGVNFWPGRSRRGVLKEYPMDILGIPLFIKAPNQHKEVISDRAVKTIDILPTIAEILNINVPWPVDGRSALDSSLPDEIEKVVFIRKGVKAPFVYERNLAARHDTLERKLALFGQGVKTQGLFTVSSHNDLVGQSISMDKVKRDGSVVIELDQPLIYEDVDPKGTLLPTLITGRVCSNLVITAPLNLSVAVNSTVHAVTRTFIDAEGNLRFTAMVPETAFRAGNNDIEVFVVSRVAGQISLERTTTQSTVSYFLSASHGRRGESIISSNGKSIPIIPNALRGHINVADDRSDHVVLAGWAADVKNSQIPEAIVIFLNGNFFYSGSSNRKRPDVVKVFDSAALLRAGFQYSFPLSLFNDIGDSKVRIFALSKQGVASEIKGKSWARNH